jgi:hypothetical protein
MYLSVCRNLLLTHSFWCIIHNHSKLCNTHKVLSKSLNKIPLTNSPVQWLVLLVCVLELLIKTPIS